MAKPHGSVRIGPISLFTLIIILCLAVLAVLSVTTARAELSITERQAATTTETYQLEVQAQEFAAEVDAALAQGAAALDEVLARYGIAGTVSAGAGPSSGETIEDEAPSGNAPGASGIVISEESIADPITVAGSFDGERISATFAMESGRTLAIVLRINDNGTYTIEQWKTTTQWTDDGAGENLWLG